MHRPARTRAGEAARSETWCVLVARPENERRIRALVEDRAHSPRVKAAIEKIHHAQAALQNATIDHIIEMRTVLDEDQFTEFLEATADSLRPTENNH